LNDRVVIRVNRQAVILGFGAAVLLVSSWLIAAETGVAIAGAGMGFGWLVRFLSAPHDDDMPAVAEVEPVAERLRLLEAKTSTLRHDLRGILSPALLTAERLLGHEDPVIRRAGEMMVTTVERASARLAETKQ
jgi:signal transduction histidine kinase